MSVRRRGKSWVADFRDAFGRRRQIAKPTQALAQAEEAKGRAAARQGLAPEIDPDITLAEYVRDVWPAKRAAHDVDPGTIHRQEIDLRRHILPVFGKDRFTKISRPRVRAFIAAKLGESTARGTGREGWSRRAPEKPLARGSVLNIYHTLSAILTEAVEDQLLLANPIRGLWRSLSKGKSARVPRSSRRRKALDLEQARLFAASVQRNEPRHWPYLATLMMAGLRPSEGLALTPDKIDFVGARIHVDVQVAQHPDRTGSYLKATKSGEVRDVDMAAGLALILRTAIDVRKRAHVTVLNYSKNLESSTAAQSRSPVSERVVPGAAAADHATSTAAAAAPDYRRELRAPVGEPGPWIFYPELSAKPTSNTVQNAVKNATRAMRRALEKAGLPSHFGLHALRHTFGNNLVRLGYSLKFVQQQMGHASIQTTADDYADSIPTTAPGAVDRIADAISGAAECNKNATSAPVAAVGGGVQSVQGGATEGLTPHRLPSYPHSLCSSITPASTSDPALNPSESASEPADEPAQGSPKRAHEEARCNTGATPINKDKGEA